jgi:hypothetical protein
MKPIVVCIDLGTSQSGIAWALRKRPSEIICEQISVSSRIFKTPTALLLNASDQSVIAFGDNAIQQWLEADEEEAKRYLFFRHFKMSLYEGNSTIKAFGSLVEVSTLKVFSLSLQYLKDFALTKLNGKTDTPVQSSDVHWVIGVPAIWNEKSKQFMKQAAQLAGMDISNDNHFTLALESEVSALFCRVRHQQIVEPKSFYLEAGSQAMVCDLGGGTADFTLHETVNEHTLSEVCASSGGDWGSTQIDKQFTNFLDRLLGVTLMTEYRQSHPMDWNVLLSDFEIIKVSIDLKSMDKVYHLRLPLSLVVMARAQLKMGELRGKQMELSWSDDFHPPVVKEKKEEKEAKEAKEAKEENFLNLQWEFLAVDQTSDVILKKNLSGVLYHNAILKIPISIVLSFFDAVKGPIVQHIQQKIADHPKLKYIFSVGGLAESAVLRKAIDDLASTKSIIHVSPPHSSQSVMAGGVLFALQTQTVSSRIAKKTYGISTCHLYSEKHHGLSQKTTTRIRNGVPTKFVEEVFCKLCNMGDKLVADVPVVKNVSPARDDQQEITFRIFEMDTPVTDPSRTLFTTQMKLCSTLKVNMPIPNQMETKDALKRLVTLRLFFGKTDIQITATDQTSGSHSNVSIFYE